MRLKSPAAMTAQTMLSFVRILTASVETHSEDFCPVMVNLVIVTFGQTIDVLEAVQCIMEAGIAIQRASVKQVVAAIFRGTNSLVSGVNGVPVMVR